MAPHLLADKFCEEGIYWAICNSLAERAERIKLGSLFGRAFEDYVSWLLEPLRARGHLHRGHRYRREGSEAEAADLQHVSKGSVVLVEAKKAFLRVDVHQTGSWRQFVGQLGDPTNVLGGAGQLARVIADWQSGHGCVPGLDHNAASEIWPVVVCSQNIPFSGPIREEILKTPEARRFSSFKRTMPLEIINIEELEIMDSAWDRVGFADVLRGAAGRMDSLGHYLKANLGVDRPSGRIKARFDEAADLARRAMWD